MTDISRIRRLAGLLNEDHDPATQNMLDQACDCAQPDCERCNPPVNEGATFDAGMAHAKKGGSLDDCPHHNEDDKKEWLDGFHTVNSFDKDGRLEESIEDAYLRFMSESAAAVEEGFADAIADDMKDRAAAKPAKRNGFANAIASDMKNRKRRADSERPVSEGGFEDAVAGDMKDRAAAKPKRDGFASAIASDMKNRKRRADQSRPVAEADIEESMDEPGQRYEPWNARNAAGYPGGEDASTWEDCEDCGGDGLDARGRPCFNCSGEGGWTRDEEEEPIDEDATAPTNHKEALERVVGILGADCGDGELRSLCYQNLIQNAREVAEKALKSDGMVSESAADGSALTQAEKLISKAMDILRDAGEDNVCMVLDNAHSQVCSLMSMAEDGDDDDDSMVGAAPVSPNWPPISPDRASQAIEKSKTGGRFLSQPSDFLTHDEKDAVRDYFMTHGKGTDTFNSILQKIANNRP